MQERAQRADRAILPLCLRSVIVVLARLMRQWGFWARCKSSSPFDRDHSIAWIVSRAHPDRSEVDRTFKTIFPSQWYQYREWPHHCYKWLTGAQMFNATAESIDGLRAKGRVDFVMINEGWHHA